MRARILFILIAVTVVWSGLSSIRIDAGNGPIATPTPLLPTQIRSVPVQKTNNVGLHKFAMGFSPDGKNIVGKMTDESGKAFVIIWDLQLKEVHRFAITTEQDIRDVQYAGHSLLILTGQGEGQAIMLDPTTGKEQYRLVLPDEISYIAVLPGGTRFLTGQFSSSQVVEWDAASGKKIGLITDQSDDPNSIGPMTATENFALMFGGTGQAKYLDLKTGKEVREYGTDTPFNAAILVSDNTAILIDQAAGNWQGAWLAHPKDGTITRLGQTLYSFAVSSDGKYWIARESEAFALFDVETQQPLRQFLKITLADNTDAIIFSPDDQYIVVNEQEPDRISLWETGIKH